MNRGSHPKSRIRVGNLLKDLSGNAVVQRVRCALGKARRIRLLPYTLLFASIAALPVLCGCVAHVHTRFPFYFHAHDYHYRPHPKYFCYDCHGYRYFDPYYDYCAHFGFRMRWDRYSSLRSYHRRYLPRIRRITPHFGEYKYKPGYRKDAQYKSPVDYNRWKKSEGRTFYSGKKKSTEVKRKSGQSQKRTGETKKKSTKK
ncbi:MAG: hypothetical protein AMJ46_11840 [Latescibacteria bacterium DG_63]|nr:MAG: hypothetical protein AMJ46_11840 [Latescibacteria bacterium DG_63]